ncbi:16S rRNA (cytosine(1402)-N(4))-methyltransferase, partial [Campylobacter jejuni]|nr:16S rRNA (cytosine(1402)-N(4))-methyltransferase [Campylobacter jejuni]
MILEIPHIPVLLNEVQEIFKNLKTGYFLDCTLGFGGHSEALLKNHPDLKFI